MAKCVTSPKGFKTIECTRDEMMEKALSPGICDNCCATPRYGVYVAVLNRWFCPGCYGEWHARAERYPQNMRIEEKNYDFYKTLLDAEEVGDA